jgi:dihydroneopterin aldolase
MAGTISVMLKGVRLYAMHGLYHEEASTGNEFEVDLTVCYKPVKKVVTEIDETINYVTLYEILQKIILKQRHHLLETCAMQIAEEIKSQFPQVKSIEISIHKLNAPISHFIGTVGITYSKKFKERSS